MPNQPNPEPLARALGCDPYDMPTRPLSVDGVTIGGGIERRCGAHGRAMSQCQIAKAAGHVLADPGPLLEALAEAGVLWEDSRKRLRWLYDDHGPIDNVLITERRYVTGWRPTDGQ